MINDDIKLLYDELHKDFTIIYEWYCEHYDPLRHVKTFKHFYQDCDYVHDEFVRYYLINDGVMDHDNPPFRDVNHHFKLFDNDLINRTPYENRYVVVLLEAKRCLNKVVRLCSTSDHLWDDKVLPLLQFH